MPLWSRLLLAGALLGATASVAAAQPAAATTDDAVAIRALVERMCHAWSPQGDPGVMRREVLSDRAFVLVTPQPGQEAEAQVLDKVRFCDLFEAAMQRQRPQRHEHRIESLIVLGPVAYELGVVEHVPAQGQTRTDRVMNVFAREAQGWRLVFSTSRPLPPPADPAPADAEATVRRLAQEFIAGFQTENPTTARRLEEMLADDFQAATSDGRRFVGKRECLEFYARVAADLGARWRQLACEFSIHKVYVFGDGAVAFGQVRFAGRTRGEDQDRLERYWETLVFRREGGQWRLLQEHSTPDNTKPALPPGPGVGPAVVP